MSAEEKASKTGGHRPPLQSGHLLLALAVLAVFVWSGINPFDRLTWWLEVFPAIGGTIILAVTYRRFRFTTLVYTFIALHMILLCVGGHYTYAKVPLGEWMRDLFHFHRNHYDRIGHFAQGFVPALITRELFLRIGVLNRKRWLPFIVISVCLGISAFYEFIEWWTALAGGAASMDFLGTQGDPWDTQEDMFMAFIGAICALVFMSKWQDRQIQILTEGNEG